jgi:hypothetical protein
VRTGLGKPRAVGARMRQIASECMAGLISELHMHTPPLHIRVIGPLTMTPEQSRYLTAASSAGRPLYSRSQRATLVAFRRRLGDRGSEHRLHPLHELTHDPLVRIIGNAAPLVR